MKEELEEFGKIDVKEEGDITRIIIQPKREFLEELLKGDTLNIKVRWEDEE